MKLGFKELLGLSIISLVAIDSIILLNIPLLRPLVAFTYFALVPGFLILATLRFGQLFSVKGGVLSFGASIAVLLFVGGVANLFYPFVGISRPLSTIPLVVTVTLVIVVLHLAAYSRTSGQRELTSKMVAKLRQTKKAIDPFLLFPVLFPFLAIFGTYLMNGYGNNLLLLALLVLIPCYTVTLLYYRNRVSAVVFPAAIFFISAALLLKHGLTSQYLLGGDAATEFQAFQLTADAAHWELLPAAQNPGLSQFTGTLSTSLLPAVLNSLLNLDPLYIYKVVYPVILAAAPVCVYVIASRYLDHTRAFLASFLFIFQVYFIEGVGETIRAYPALLFCALAFLVLTDAIEGTPSRSASIAGSLQSVSKSLPTYYSVRSLEDDGDIRNRWSSSDFLLLLFAASMILSHYTTAYIFITVLFITWALSALVRYIYRIKKTKYGVNYPLVIFLSAVVFLWYGMITRMSFSVGVVFLENTFRALQDAFVLESRSQGVLTGFGANVSAPAQWCRVVATDAVVAFVGIGTFSVVKNIRRNFSEYFIMLLAGLILIALWVIIPFLAIFGISRLLQILIIFLAPAFFFGVDFVFKSLRAPRFAPFIAIILVLVLVVSNTYLLDQLLGGQASTDLNTGGVLHDGLFIYPSEAAGARWISSEGQPNTTVGSDLFGGERLILAGTQVSTDNTFFENNYYGGYTNNDTYVYLRHGNLEGLVYLVPWYGAYKQPAQTVPTTSFSNVFNGSSKIYDSGGAAVFKS